MSKPPAWFAKALVGAMAEDAHNAGRQIAKCYCCSRLLVQQPDGKWEHVTMSVEPKTHRAKPIKILEGK